MTEFLLFLVSVLLVMTVVAAIEYYRRLGKVQREYEKAGEAVEDIVLSFNRQLKSEAEKLELIAYKVEAISSRTEKHAKASDEVSKKLESFDEKLGSFLGSRDKEANRLDEVDKKICDVAASLDSLAAKVLDLEQRKHELSIIPEAKIEAVIPIRREKALAPLTETELLVLEMLTLEGSKTAPEIKDRIKLSREHTARLMKKLFEEGYLERNTSKIPFRYSVKKEMENILKKKEKELA